MFNPCCGNDLCICGAPADSWAPIPGPMIGPGCIDQTMPMPSFPDLHINILNDEERNLIVDLFRGLQNCGCHTTDKCGACVYSTDIEKAIDILMGPARKAKKRKEATAKIDKEIKDLQGKIRELKSRKTEL